MGESVANLLRVQPFVPVKKPLLGDVLCGPLQRPHRPSFRRDGNYSIRMVKHVKLYPHCKEKAESISGVY